MCLYQSLYAVITCFSPPSHSARFGPSREKVARDHNGGRQHFNGLCYPEFKMKLIE